MIRETNIEEAIEFLKSQGFQINLVDGVYRIRKEDWRHLPYEVDAETLIEQANLLRAKSN